MNTKPNVPSTGDVPNISKVGKPGENVPQTGAVTSPTQGTKHINNKSRTDQRASARALKGAPTTPDRTQSEQTCVPAAHEYRLQECLGISRIEAERISKEYVRDGGNENDLTDLREYAERKLA